MPSEERELEELLRIKKRRLMTLRKQIAQLGYGARPELITERDELEQEIGATSKVIEPIVKGELPDDIMAALRAYGVPASVNNALQLVESRLYELKNTLEGYGQELHTVKNQIAPIANDVQALKDDNEIGKQGRRRNFWLFIFAITLLIVILGLAIGTIVAGVL